MTHRPTSPTMSYTQLMTLATPTTTPAPTASQVKPAISRTAPPATINVYRKNMTPSSSSLPPSVLFSDSMPMSAARADANHSNQVGLTATIEDRLSNLTMKLNSTDSSNHQPHQSCKRLGEIHNFIDILKNMQMVVSNTVDEQQRQKKARALNTLLTMFESIIDERHKTSQQPSTHHLEWKIQCLESENERLQCHCKDSDTNLQHRNQELTLLQQDIQRMADDNDRLRKDLATVQDQCQQEYLRAQEAEQVAAESEMVRNGLLSTYGRLTEENVDLIRAIEDINSEKSVLSKTLASIREEVDALTKQSNQLSKQLRDSNKLNKEMESLLDCANAQLQKQKNEIQSANEDRRRIQDELHMSQRNSASTSAQLIKLRDEFTKKLQLDRSKANDSLAKKFEEEHKRRLELEELVSKARGKEDSAEELMRALARSNATLKSQVNQMVARMNQSPCTFESDVVVEECTKDVPNQTKESDNISCYF